MLQPDNDRYNYHSHTQFCDGHASMEEMAAAAFDAGMQIWGFSPHSPICVESPCNMSTEDFPAYYAEATRLKEMYEGKMQILTGMEIDFLSKDFGPHIDFFQKLPLNYSIGSVHFVPTQDGIPVDCDGSFGRFSKNLSTCFRNDLRYVVEKFFEQELILIELGGFDILGHFDKIAANASLASPGIEEEGWYRALVDDVIRHAHWKGYHIEINTKSFADKNRFFPAEWIWPSMLTTLSEKGESPLTIKEENTIPTSEGVPFLNNSKILINSDAHYPDKVDASRDEAFTRLLQLSQW